MRLSVAARHSALLGLAAALVAGCSSSSSESDEATASWQVIRLDGSSTVFPISEAVAEEFQKAHPGARVTVGISGTGGGFQKFCRAETDISDASRPIKPTEIEACRGNKIEFSELPVAYDGIVVAVNPKNTWVDRLTVDELKRIWAPESQGQVMRWSQVRAGWPDRELHLFGPGVDSGTYDYFTEAVNGKEGASRGDFTSSEDDNVLVQGIATDELALGFFGIAYYEENADKLKAIPIDDGNEANGAGAVEATVDHVKNGTYQPLSRPLFVYVSHQSAERPEVQTFVDFYLKEASSLAAEVGYVPLNSEGYSLAQRHFADRVPGSVFESGGSQVGISIEDLLSRETR
jgi:phosphate transport system substrate-binding protein